MRSISTQALRRFVSLAAAGGGCLDRLALHRDHLGDGSLRTVSPCVDLHLRRSEHPDCTGVRPRSAGTVGRATFGVASPGQDPVDSCSDGAPARPATGYTTQRNNYDHPALLAFTDSATADAAGTPAEAPEGDAERGWMCSAAVTDPGVAAKAEMSAFDRALSKLPKDAQRSQKPGRPSTGCP
jgi:hypothetical protein